MSSRRAKAQLHQQLERSRAAHDARHASGLQAELSELESWQKLRLKRSYADFDSNPRFRPATLFFRETLYAPVNLEQRDADLERMVPTMVRLLPDSVLMTVVHALELQALSLELDLALAQACVAEGLDAAELTAANYCAAYRYCDNREVRAEQIELLGLVGSELEHWVHVPFVYSTLLLCRVPAKLAGLTELQHFLEEGFTAFREMRGADDFLAAIEAREQAILSAVFAGDNDPFDWKSLVDS